MNCECGNDQFISMHYPILLCTVCETSWTQAELKELEEDNSGDEEEQLEFFFDGEYTFEMKKAA